MNDDQMKFSNKVEDYERKISIVKENYEERIR